MPITIAHRCASRAAVLLALPRPAASRQSAKTLVLPCLPQHSRRPRMSDSQRAAASSGFEPTKPTLIDIPVSNNGARARFIIYKLGLENEVDIASPAVLGGMRSENFLSLNPQAKIPLLIDTDGTCVPESEVIVLYLLEKFSDKGSQLVPSTLALKAKARLISRLVDVYITPIQGAMYKQMEAGLRHAQIQQLARQLDILEQTIEGPFALGQSISHSDASIFPTLDFMEFMLPSIFGWKDVYLNRPKLKAYREAILKDPAGARVSEELQKALGGWKEKRRWDELGITNQVKNQDYNWACS